MILNMSSISILYSDVLPNYLWHHQLKLKMSNKLSQTWNDIFSTVEYRKKNTQKKFSIQKLKHSYNLHWKQIHWLTMYHCTREAYTDSGMLSSASVQPSTGGANVMSSSLGATVIINYTAENMPLSKVSLYWNSPPIVCLFTRTILNEHFQNIYLIMTLIPILFFQIVFPNKAS